MIIDWINVKRVKVSGAERLYPHGLDWELKPGVNAVVGGTGLGKTTFVKALQYSIFDKMVGGAGERVDRDFFRGRLTDRPPESVKEEPPTVRVEFSVASSSFLIERNLLSGVLVNASYDGTPLKASQYRDKIAEMVGLPGDFASVVRLQSQLMFFGEERYLLAWDNLQQNELLNLMLSDHGTYSNLNQLWRDVESADSEARNLSAQASRLEKDLERYVGSSNVRELERRSSLKELVASGQSIERRLRSLSGEIRKEELLLSAQDEEAARAHLALQQEAESFEEEVGADLDDELINAALASTPTVASVRYSLEKFFQTPHERPCPCCGRPGLSPLVAEFAREAGIAAQSGHCVVCSKDIDARPHHTVKARLKNVNSADASAVKLQSVLFKREQTRSRLEGFRQEEIKLRKSLEEAREAELAYLRQNPGAGVQPLRVAVDELRRRQKAAERRRDSKLKKLRTELDITNAAFTKIQVDIAAAFKKYATLYLDEDCDVKLLVENELPGRRGPQVKAPHAAFYPVISGRTRSSAQALSDAQRAFIDLAFRMAAIEVWHHRTGKTVTMIVETPEGAVDLAYMERVASMLRTFSEQGHTLIVTTNLNNDVFLPDLLSSGKKSQRLERILNLIELGRPREVQKRHRARFNDILRAVESHRLSR